MLNFFKSIFTYVVNTLIYFKEHFPRFLIIVLILVISCSILPFCCIQNTYTDSIIVEQNVLLFGITLSNWGTYITIVGLIITAIWAIYQFDKNKIIKQQEKASEIAKEFADILAEKLSIISTVLTSDEKIGKLLSDIDKSKLKSFDYYEIINISKNKEIYNEYNTEIMSEEIQAKYEYILHNNYNEEESKRFSSNFLIMLETTLNELEYICMNISSEAAGSQYIYPSLHQLFLPFIHLVSVKIARGNVNATDKYFINIIAVYNMWNDKRNRDIEHFNKIKLKIQKLEKKKKKEIQKILHKKPKTV